jgi:hypothetical protein
MAASCGRSGEGGSLPPQAARRKEESRLAAGDRVDTAVLGPFERRVECPGPRHRAMCG